VRTKLRQAIEREYLQMRMAYATYTQLAGQAADYEGSFREARVKFEAGALNAAEFVLVRRDLDQAKPNLIAARYPYIPETEIPGYYQGRLGW
jgi:outer membrane protein